MEKNLESRTKNVLKNGWWRRTQVKLITQYRPNLRAELSFVTLMQRAKWQESCQTEENVFITVLPLNV